MKLSAAALLFVTTCHGLEQYTPNLANWTTLNEKVLTNHTLDAILWISDSDWKSWDGTIYDPTNYTRSDFSELICPSFNTVRGLREVFADNNPFEDPDNPTKAEVDNWHMIAVNHVRAMVNYTEDEYQIEPDKCLHIRALWSDERKNTRMWDEKYPNGTCEGTTNPHCGAGFIPSDEDQQRYLPDNITSCGSTAGSEGMFSASKSSIPWSLRWARSLCYTLRVEGFWGGHTGPWFHRSKFGWAWRDSDPSKGNSNAGLRAKWAGSSGDVKYVDPRITNGDHLVLMEGVDPNPRFTQFQCEENDTVWRNAANATHCYDQMMEDPECGKRFMTYKIEGGGCACYPVEMESCKVQDAASRSTWDFEPRVDSFDGLFIDPNEEFTKNALPYNGRECPNIQWVLGNAGDRSHCVQKLVESNNPDCGRNFLTWNEANGGCGCYSPVQTCERDETKRASGRQTYQLKVDPSYYPPTPTPPGTEAPTKAPFPLETEAPNPPPTEAPSSSPTEAPIEPTNAPVDPTNAPVDPPTPLGTEAPTPSPTDDPCYEDLNAKFHFRTKVKKGKKDKHIPKTCNWLSKLTKTKPKKQKKICKKEKKSSSFEAAAIVCPRVCSIVSGKCD